MDYKGSKRRRETPGYSPRRIRKTPLFDTESLFTFSKLLKYGFFVLLGIIIVIPVVFFWYSRDLPVPGKVIMSKYKNATQIYDRHGTLLYSVYQDENRTYASLNQIPKKLQEATIAIEDKDFYKNNGFSPIAYLRVVKNYLLGHGLGGGSTISQQLVKNTLLTSERSIPRKIKELILAIQINQKYSKDQILEMYLNNIAYGGNSIGVEAASEMYFGKKVKNLDLAQSAFLAGLPQSPSLYSPFTGKVYYLNRLQAVLRQMVVDGYISQSDADDAYKEIKNYKFSENANASIKAPHFVMYVRDILAKQFGEQMVAAGGLQVTTSLDYTVQKNAEQIVKDEIGKLKAYKVSNGAAIVANPQTGEVLAMVGSADYFDKANNGNFNAALADRQPGSSLKPIMYATAFEKGYTPATLVMDTKTDFPTNDSAHPTYTPVNYDGKFHGPMQIRYALGNSVNIPAVKMLARVGIQPVMQKAYDMGIENWQPTQSNRASVGLSLVLGGRETTLLNEITAYSVFANEGIRQDPVTILKVTDDKGNVLYQYKKTEGKRVLSKEVSYLIANILSDDSARAMEFGAHSWLSVPGHTVSVKTGTTDEKRDNWTVGYTPSYVVGVWVGNNDNSPMNQAIASGITGASPIWNKIMSYVLKGKPDQPEPKPDDVISMQIDSLAGGLPHGGQPTRTEYFVKGTEPTSESPVYKSKDGQNYLVFKEDDPVSTDGVNRWQQGIQEWEDTEHKDDKMYHPPDDLTGNNSNTSGDTPTPTPEGNPTATTDPQSEFNSIFEKH